MSEVEGLNVPQGKSYWEIGTNENYKDKAQGDFEKRTREVLTAEQAEYARHSLSLDVGQFRSKKQAGGLARCMQSQLVLEGRPLHRWFRARNMA